MRPHLVLHVRENRGVAAWTLATIGKNAQIAPKAVRVSIRKEALDLLVGTLPNGSRRVNILIPLGVRAINRLRRSAGSEVTVTNPRRSNGFNAAVKVVRSIASRDAKSAIAGGAGRFSDISKEN